MATGKMATISIKGQICDGPIAKMIVSLKAQFSNIFHLSAGLHRNVGKVIRDWAYDSLRDHFEKKVAIFLK